MRMFIVGLSLLNAGLFLVLTIILHRMSKDLNLLCRMLTRYLTQRDR